MRISLLLLSLLILSSCVSNSSEDKEKELLEKELALTKKELELTKMQDSIETKKDDVTKKDEDLSKNVGTEVLVFNTNMLSYKKQAKINGKECSIKIKRSEVEADNPPFESQTTLIFSLSEIPNLLIDSYVVSYVIKDLNNDGKEEVVVCTQENGTWAHIEVYSLTNNMKWKRPYNSFMWWTDTNGCDAKMYWNSAKKQMRIVTTNSDSEHFECNDESIVLWK